MTMLFQTLSLSFLLAHSVSSLEFRATDEYSFEQYVKEFHKEYSSKEEYRRREGIFLQNLAVILDHNSNRDSSIHYMDINHFTDRQLENELPLGYDKSMHRAWSSEGGATSVERRTLSFDTEDVKKLPDSVDWRSKGRVTTAVKNQLHCGSCWAFATTACMESHVAIQTGKLFTLSVQELVSCMDNPDHCGGTGGCAGATTELGYDFISQHGMVDEWTFGYQSGHGEKVNCTIMDDGSKHLRGEESKKIKGAVASVTGFSSLPTNDYDSLMTTVATMGPVAVSVAATGWGLYRGGIYDDSKDKHRDINHAVVLEGYGTDEETGQDYWLVRNSWGPLWGEDGYIRLKRTDPSTLDDAASDCKMDVTPSDGVACTKDDSGNDIVPKAVSVCGTSGILFDSTVPIGAHLVRGRP